MDNHTIIPEPPPATQDNGTALPAEPDHQTEDGGDYCRICRGEGTAEQPLFYPCKCSGSIRYVHQDCLMEWLAHSKKKYCELCKTPFRFTKLYDKSMPATLPFPLFLRQLILHGLETFVRWSRYFLVVLVWFACLPWCIRQVWRGLFWLADGSWLSETQYRINTLHRLNATLADLEHMNASITENVIESLNRTLLELDGILNTTLAYQQEKPPSITSLLNSFLRLLTGETLVSKLFRFLFSVPPVQVSSSTKSDVVKSLGARPPPQRPSSLLSDMELAKRLTASPTINNLTVDVAEGLLICLGLVAGFILVFLIREWVINQQPMLNIPDADAADNPQRAPPAAPVIRPRRRRVLPRGVDQVGLPPLPVDQAMLRQAPGMPPRRAFTDDNIALPVAHERDRPELPVRAASLIRENFVPTESRESPDSAEEHPSPPPLVRGALGDVVNVHRSIEERVPEATVAEQTDNENLDLDAARLDHGAPGALHDAVAVARPTSPDPHVTASLDSNGQNPQVSGLSTTEVGEDSQPASDSDEPPVPTPESDEYSIPTNVAEAGDIGHDDLSNQDRADESNAPPETQPGPQPFANRLADWLWRVDGPVSQRAQELGQDDMHVIEDVHAEPPFVPMHHGAILPPIVQPQQDPPVAVEPEPPQDHAPIQIEWNDQIAAEEAEDLEGVLELVGMEGPLVGMVQNVIFSLFLITLTLTASVWIPYVWGKLALIFLAHPTAVAVKGPSMLISNVADMIADIGIFVLGLCGLFLNHVTKFVRIITKSVYPPLSNLLDTGMFEELALNATKHSGSRLERAITGAATAVTLSSDLPTFSMESHRSLLVFKSTIANAYSTIATAADDVRASLLRFSWTFEEQRKWAMFTVQGVRHISGLAFRAVHALRKDDLKALLKSGPPRSDRLPVYSQEDVLADWTTHDKIIAIALGYIFFAVAGVIFMKASRIFYGLRKEEKVPGALADSLRQAGGVLKVVVIIGIEMLVFPLYCGLLLDFALLPLFEGATVWTRLAFIRRAPFTGLFLHWFLGTCYMFHFALFVSMCRKILRRGVLYFIRDPDDPTFHPVRDVLERPVPTQLGKIAFSALVYGGLVIMCLGGVVWGIGSIDGVLPIHWSTPEPRLAFPMDVVFYNFLLPVIIRRYEPSKKLAAVYEWWFRGCAHGLRLSHFLFGEEHEDEKLSDAARLPWLKSQPKDKDGSYVRAPGSDSCRIPKGQKVFLDVDEENKRLDDKPEQEKGLHGKTDDKWTKIYLPPKYKARLATFIALLWVFAAGTGVTLTIAPLLVGRFLIMWVSGSPGPVNDLYAITVGLHVLGFAVYVATHAKQARQWTLNAASWVLSRPKEALPHIWSTTKYSAGMLYLFTAFGIIFPFTLSLITELYIHIPVFTFLLRSTSASDAGTPITSQPPSAPSSPTVFILQTWTLGLLYFRLALRIALNYPSPDSRVATAIRAIVRNGYMDPDITQATRAIVLPLSALCIILLAAPLGYAKLLIAIMRVGSLEEQERLYRFAYPGLMGILFTGYGSMVLGQRMEIWRMKIRDEVYLVGERLHNYAEKDRSGESKGKERVTEEETIVPARLALD